MMEGRTKQCNQSYNAPRGSVVQTPITNQHVISQPVPAKTVRQKQNIRLGETQQYLVIQPYYLSRTQKLWSHLSS